MKTRDRKKVLSSAALVGVLSMCLPTPGAREVQGENNRPAAAAAYHSPLFLAVSPDGNTVYTSDPTAGCLAILDADGKTKRGEVSLRGNPRGLCLSPDGRRLYVCEHGAGSVAVIDTAKGEVTGRIAVGRWPTAVALAPKTDRLYVCNQDSHSVTVIDLRTAPGTPVKQIPVLREPSFAAVTPDERYVVVTNLLAYGVSTDPTLAAEVSILDTSKLVQLRTVKLPPGSTVVNGVCTSPDGKWAYVVHGLGRFNLPITQLERGWVNTFALSILDIAAGTKLVTVLLDDLTQGAADPYAVVCSKEGSRLWISHAGTHEVSTVEIGLVHELLEGNVPESLASLQDGTRPNVWVRIQKDRKVIEDLENDLTALYIADAIRRVPSKGLGPRGLALSPDEKKLFVANYYSGRVAILDTASGRLVGEISLGPQQEPDTVRRGEIIFHDATHAFQHWHSCSSCHPNQGRVDGLRWDFLGDGIGNGKNTLSLLFVNKTEPLNRRATVATAREGAFNGLNSTHMIVPTEEDVDDLFAYLCSLRPVPSPHLTAEGNLSDAAQRGKVLFETKANCAGCHPAPLFTDRKMHNIGVLSDNEPDGRYDTPSLLEAYRTAPYLHDGRALSVKDVLTVHAEKGVHGKVKGLSKQQIDDLAAYVLSL